MEHFQARILRYAALQFAMATTTMMQVGCANQQSLIARLKKIFPAVSSARERALYLEQHQKYAQPRAVADYLGMILTGIARMRFQIASRKLIYLVAKNAGVMVDSLESHPSHVWNQFVLKANFLMKHGFARITLLTAWKQKARQEIALKPRKDSSSPLTRKK